MNNLQGDAEFRVECLACLALNRNRLDRLDAGEFAATTAAMAALNADDLVLVLSAAQEAAELMAKIGMLIVMGTKPKGVRP